ncbi:MAG: hypothetical protein PHG82_04435 [Candidatus Gracilibacteria bacterium]|nr:hypothetical protein [Candidatus Gracilibacteria bacterium]
MCKVILISDEELNRILEEDTLYRKILELDNNVFEEISFEQLAELEEENYNSLETDYSKMHNKYSSFELDEE